MSLLALQLCLIAPCLPVQEPPSPAREASDHPTPTRFVSLTRTEWAEPVSLRTATVRYRPPEGDLTVDLISAVHVGDASYYRELNERFTEYEALLYELVAPAGEEVPTRGDGPGGLLALLQEAGAAYLGLTNQLEHIDYSPANFVHADLSPREMAEAWEERGESGLTLALGMLTDVLREGNLEARRAGGAEGGLDRELLELDPFELLFDPEGGNKLKRLMAVELSRQARASELGRTLDRILIEDRNEAAMKVLLREIAKGKKHIGIFYGAAHMPDFERRLVLELGLQRERVEWTTAWDLEKPSDGGVDLLLRMMDDLLETETDR